ncbi:hypothetical protein HY522_02595 [bacterium]|nr:hypothetical protein [bacterium]
MAAEGGERFRLFNRGDILAFLGEVDGILAGGGRTAAADPVSVIIIGGSGIALKYDPSHGTKDIDTYSHGPADQLFMNACERVNAARSGSGKVPVQCVGIADGPWGFEERLLAVEADFKRMRVSVPEAHDLILMKIVRGEERDIEGIRAIGKAVAIDPDRLASLYTRDMSHCIGDKRRLRLNFLDAYAALFGVARAKKIESSIPVHGPM